MVLLLGRFIPIIGPVAIAGLLPAIRLTLCCLLMFLLFYPLLLLGLAKGLALNGGQGETIAANGRRVGYYHVGQNFSADRYFWSRPSATNYNPTGSAGSNKGPTNAGYLAQVQARLDTFLVHNPGVSAAQVPAELLTASGSGIDPHLSPAGAWVQVARVARSRGLAAERLRQLVTAHTEGPLWGLFGGSVVNVLALNVALDELQ
ncbi:MAG: potassium-transporting ATPase subunit KdpC [Saprospiraceae bacterium]